MQETWVQSLGREDLLEKEMATHSSIFAWKIPWTEGPGELQSMVLQSQTQLSDFDSLTQKLFIEKNRARVWIERWVAILDWVVREAFSKEIPLE